MRKKAMTYTYDGYFGKGGAPFTKSHRAISNKPGAFCHILQMRRYMRRIRFLHPVINGPSQRLIDFGD